ncbi:Metapyrocatechase [Nostocoides australiense Ben110]|uniref:Metapyrocatechase n=1 Tax=Nostocoides australiense Ben110 TaxID=1193182 RepID=W6K3V8_9MICO|nr:catechol 2,3-dioxygenase [Tetrasphaera australiensis]CCH73939.1 Metapyrocatechase [Tetrasphaera australiensis Ben110]
MAVMRMGYVHARVTDLAEAKEHYANTLGLYETHSEPGKVFYKGWDEWDHHSVVLEEGGVGVAKFGFKVEYESDIDAIEKKAQDFGLTVERMSAGDNLEVSDGIRFTSPSEHVFEVYHSQKVIGTEVGTHNPDAFPRHLVGVGVPALDHALILAENVRKMEDMFKAVFDFFPTERVQTDLNDDDAHFIASWMTCNNQIHQIAVLEGEQSKLHHFAFKLDNWDQVGRAADLFSMDDVPIDIGPTRHGITRGQTIYFFDPAGNRNEVFAGGYPAYRDRPINKWTPDAIAKGIFYHARELNERFTTVYT